VSYTLPYWKAMNIANTITDSLKYFIVLCVKLVNGPSVFE